MPEVEPHDPEDGILHNPSNPLRLLPFAHPLFTEAHVQLVCPAVDHVLEADRTERLEVLVGRGITRFGIAGPTGSPLLAEMEQDAEEEHRFSITMQVLMAVLVGVVRVWV